MDGMGHVCFMLFIHFEPSPCSGASTDVAAFFAREALGSSSKDLDKSGYLRQTDRMMMMRMMMMMMTMMTMMRMRIIMTMKMMRMMM